MTLQRLLFAIIAASLMPAAAAAEKIKIGFPMPLSGPGRGLRRSRSSRAPRWPWTRSTRRAACSASKIELLTRDSKASADEAVRVARELIIKDNVDFLVGTLTSAEAPAVSTIAKENKIVFIAPTSKTDPADRRRRNLHPYIFRIASNTDIEGRTGAVDHGQVEGREEGRHHRARLCLWPRRRRRLRRLHEESCAPTSRSSISNGRSSARADFTPFITAQMSKKPDAVFCDVFGGDFVSFVKQATPLGYFKAINNRLVDGGEVGTDRDGARRLAPTIRTASGPTPTIR